MIDRWGAFVARRPLGVVIASLLVIVAAAVYGAGVFSALSVGGLDDPGSESADEARTERAVFGNHNPDIIAIYSSEELTAEDPAFQAAVQEVVEDLPEDEVTSVVPYYAVTATGGGTPTPGTEPTGPYTGPPLVSEDGRSALVIISLEGDNLTDLLVSGDEVRPGLEADGLDLHVAGLYATQSEVSEQLQEDLEHAEMLAAPVTVLLALLIFGSLVASTMPALVGAIALIGSLAVLRLIDMFTDVNVFSLNVVSLIGLGLAIDYALFIISRFREELATLPLEDPAASRTAIQRTLATAGRTVLFSALTVAASMSTLLVFPQVFLKSMAYGGVAAVLIAMTAALTVLPAALTLLGRRVDKGRLPWLRGKPIVKPDAGRHWATLARWVMRRWAIVLPLTVLVLLAVASPFLGASFGGVNHRVLPADSPANVAFDKLEDFGPETSFANVVLEDVDEAAVGAYLADVRALRDDATATPLAQEGDTVLVQVSWQDNDQTEASQDFIRDVRDVDVDGGTAMVGGLTADTVDLTASISDRLPWMAGIIVVVMLVLLFVAFGSLVLPFKAIVMNAFSITASYGVITWIFADGNLAGVLDFTPQGYLDVTTPILMFAVLFGLSMDYEVFLLSRIREQWDLTGDNDLAVEAGVQKTGQIITSAALLLAVVIGAFATGQVVLTKMLGIGMLVALLVDATIVRAVMVPATMRLLGGRNWWAPGPLARWWDRYGFREEGAHGPALAHPGPGYPPPDGRPLAPPPAYPSPGYPAAPTALVPPPPPAYLGPSPAAAPPPPPPPPPPPRQQPPPPPPPPPRPAPRPTRERPVPATGPMGTVVRRPEDMPPPPAPPTVVAPPPDPPA